LDSRLHFPFAGFFPHRALDGVSNDSFQIKSGAKSWDAFEALSIALREIEFLFVPHSEAIQALSMSLLRLSARRLASEQTSRGFLSMFDDTSSDASPSTGSWMDITESASYSLYPLNRGDNSNDII
jgi:hypothetical protein